MENQAVPSGLMDILDQKSRAAEIEITPMNDTEILFLLWKRFVRLTINLMTNSEDQYAGLELLIATFLAWYKIISRS